MPNDHGFRYCVDFMDAFAQHLMPGLVYAGIVYAGPVPDYVRDLPHGGRDVLASKVYWQFPKGTVRCLSVRDLVGARLSDFDTADLRAAYDDAAASFG